MGEFVLGVFLPWITVFLLLACVVSSIFLIPKLIKPFLIFPLPVKIVLILILTGGVAVRFLATQPFHKIYYDEDRYLAYAVSFAHFGKATSVELATPQKLIMGKPDKVGRVTVPVIHAAGIKLIGNSELVLFQIARIASALQILLIFILSFLLLRNYVISLSSAFLMAFLPVQVYWATSLSLDSYHVFFAMLSAIAAILYARNQTLTTQTLLISSIFLLLGVRFEAFLFLFILALFYITERSKQKLPFLTKKDFITFGILGVLLVIRTGSSLSVLSQPWCCAEALPLESFGVPYFIRNLLPNIFGLFNRPEFPFIITILALYQVITKRSSAVIILAVWALAFFFLYSSYYAGKFYTFEFSGSYGRYLLMLVPPLIILASCTINMTWDQIYHYKKVSTALLWTGVFGVICLTLFPTARHYTRLTSSSPYFMAVEAGPQVMHTFLEQTFMPSIPKDAIVIHSLTAHPLLDNRPTAFIAYFYDGHLNDYLVSELKNGKKAYVLETFPCQAYTDSCKKLNGLFYFIPEESKQDPSGLMYSEVKLTEKAF